MNRIEYLPFRKCDGFDSFKREAFP
jgi:hypothetical protein